MPTNYFYKKVTIKTDIDRTFSSSRSSWLMSCALLTREHINVNSSKISSTEFVLKITQTMTEWSVK